MPTASGFINRANEIGQITDLLERIDRPALAGSTDVYLPNCVVNLHGPPGIGKSALLHELRTRLSPHSATLLIDLHSGLPEERLHEEKLRFIDEGWRALGLLPQGRPPTDTEHLVDWQDRFVTTEDEKAELVDQALTRLLTSIAKRSKQQVILLLIDSCEHASEALFAWIERFFLLPLIHDAGGGSSRAICVFASQIQLRWRQHNVRRRVRAQKLGPLSLKATREQAGDSHLGDEIYQLTYGHALSNTVAIAYLHGLGEQPSEQLSWLRANQQSVIERVIDELRRHAAASMLAKKMQPDASPDALPEGWEGWGLWAIIEPLAILREFDINSMRIVLDTYHDRFKKLNQSDLLITIRELLKTRLVEWSSLLRAYQIAPAIRQIFARALALREPEAYSKLRRKAVSYYEGQIRTVPGNRHLYLIEFLFQQVSSPDITTTSARQLGAQLADLLGKYYANASRTYLDEEGLEALERSLADDLELEQALEQQSCPSSLLRSVVQEFRAGNGATQPAVGKGGMR